MIWAASIPMLSGKLDPISYLLICMLPMLLAKLSDSISRGLMSYKNLKISKDKVVDIIEEPEETGSMEPLHTATHEITFDNVNFAYVPGEPVLKHATFTVPDQKLMAIVGDSGSGKSTILNLIAKYYEATSGTISIGGKPINHIAAERVLEQVCRCHNDRIRNKGIFRVARLITIRPIHQHFPPNIFLIVQKSLSVCTVLCFSVY